MTGVAFEMLMHACHCYRQDMTGDTVPVLIGDRPALDLVNTGRLGPDADLLATPPTAEAWVRAMAAHLTDVPLGTDLAVDSVRLDDLRLVRGAVAQVLQGRPRASSLAVVNRFDTEAAPSWTLDLGPDGAPVALRRVWGSGVDALLGLVAADCVAMVRDGLLDEIAECASPGCQLRFLRGHHRRRFCRPDCAHRTRQAAYQRRQTQ